MQSYPTRSRYVKRTVSAGFDAANGTTAPTRTQAEILAARLAQLRAATQAS